MRRDNLSGMGLGLAIVKQFVEANGGLIAVDSKPGQGSIFKIRLPRKAPVGTVH